MIRVPTIVSANPSPKRRHVGSPECLDDPVAMALTSNSPAPDMYTPPVVCASVNAIPCAGLL